MTEFLFVRHGKAANNLRPEIISGQSNEAPLTELGQAEAVLVGSYLREQQLTPEAIFSSPAIRAHGTGELALKMMHLEMPIAIDDRLLEMSQGPFEGTLRSLAYTPENIAAFEIESDHGKFPGGESLIDVQARMHAFISEKTEQYPNGTILAFSHGLAIRALAGSIRGFTKAQILAEETPNVSLTSISHNGTTPTVQYVGKSVIESYT